MTAPTQLAAITIAFLIAAISVSHAENTPHLLYDTNPSGSDTTTFQQTLKEYHPFPFIPSIEIFLKEKSVVRVFANKQPAVFDWPEIEDALVNPDPTTSAEVNAILAALIAARDAGRAEGLK